MQIALAPMEGLVDDIQRELLTSVGGVDWCVTEFVRVNDTLLPPHVFRRLAPELDHGSKTPSGTPMRVQLLGSDPACMAENAALAVSLGAPVIDLNFGCPARTVNKSRGGAILLGEPDLLYRIAAAVRAAIPAQVPMTAKMRLGINDTDLTLDCARALAASGAAELVVHARTKEQCYRPPAHWEWIARIQDIVAPPVYANGEIWTVDDWLRCKAISGAEHFMLGRGLVARPDLALQIRAAAANAHHQAYTWADIEPLLRRFWQLIRNKVPPKFAPGRAKQWLNWLQRSYPEAGELFVALRKELQCQAFDERFGLCSPNVVPRPEMAATALS